MKIISAKYIFKDGEYINNSAIVFDDSIIEVDTLDNIKRKYPNIEHIEYSKNSIIYPGFINLHTHLEFSANRAKLKLGNFIEWLYSVFEYRDELVAKLDEQTIDSAIEQMKSSGVTTFGAISSFGADMRACRESKLRVIYFNEVIGSSAAMVDALFQDFKLRLDESKSISDDRFYPAIAIHSPYSVHPFLLREVLNIAKKEAMLVTAHFLESKEEREWLEGASGAFKELFKKFFNVDTPVTSIDEFLDAFKDIKTLFTHCTQADKKELDIINQNRGSVIHCPRSNRLLNCGVLDISNVNSLLLGTDGLSSNYSLSILDELKSALFMHTKYPPKELALNLIKSVTINAANATNLNVGNIKQGAFADFAIFELPDDLSDESSGSLALNTIIECRSAKEVYIAGEKI